MSYYREIAFKINPNIKIIRKELEEFFADVLFGFGNWIWKNDISGNTVVVTQDIAFSSAFNKPFELLNRDNAISAIKTASENYDIDLTKECEYINKLSPIQLRAELVAVLYDVKSKIER